MEKITVFFPWEDWDLIVGTSVPNTNGKNNCIFSLGGLGFAIAGT